MEIRKIPTAELVRTLARLEQEDPKGEAAAVIGRELEWRERKWREAALSPSRITSDDRGPRRRRASR
jgi:hypothetical protein